MFWTSGFPHVATATLTAASPSEGVCVALKPRPLPVLSGLYGGRSSALALALAPARSVCLHQRSLRVYIAGGGRGHRSPAPLQRPVGAAD